MKTKFIIFLFLLSCRLFSQFQIDAGNDTAICDNLWGLDTIVIGGKPTAFGGIEPYTYTWSVNYTIGSLSWGASHFIDDSTTANPKLIHNASKNLKFILTVTDSIGQQLKDSITIRFSEFFYLLMELGLVIQLHFITILLEELSH